MKEPTPSTISATKLALAVRKARAEKPEVELVQSEPIAIVGIGCRFPGGVHSAEEYWRMLRDGVDTIGPIPEDRWRAADYYDPDPQKPGKTNSTAGGFLKDQDLFDPVLFGIAPREAASIDPQQRLLLEVTWESLWDSGQAPSSLAGSKAGVFVAIYNGDYGRLLMGDAAGIVSSTCAGVSHSIASGRISYLLDLHGPSLSIDTACSSSLVAVHLGCQSLRNRECSMALAGGVTLHLEPEHYIAMAKLGMLAPDGRCKTFDARANGFVPGEGCGMVVLKRLADALQNGDRIYAVIRGSAVNHDGRTNVLTAPNGLAQQDVMRAALRNAQVPGAGLSYIETHGTGTALGDPIEFEAIAKVAGENLTLEPRCALGAVKTNIGHLEAAAGVAGLIKAALALEHEEIPPNLHYLQSNPHLSFEGTRFYVPQQPCSWPRGESIRFAGVSSFGFGGTNAHIVLEESPRLARRAEVELEGERAFLLPLSSRSPEALIEAARRYRAFLSEPESGSLYGICHSVALRRDSYEERLAVTARSREEFCRLFDDFLASRSRAGISAGRATADPPPIAFVFSGQGSQWAGMGAALKGHYPVFDAALRECDALIQRRAGWSVVAELSAEGSDSRLSDTEYAQPALFALEVALARLWESWGITPDLVIGHSAGEVAAAHISGALSLEESVSVVVQRGRIMQAATGLGQMAVVQLPASVVASEIGEHASELAIGAINSPESTVISGAHALIDAQVEAWSRRGIACRMMPVNYAFHSPQMQPFREELVLALGRVDAREGAVRMISTVLGRVINGSELDAAYWGRNIRETVLFADAIQAAASLGVRTFLEVGPHPVLLPYLDQCCTKDESPTAIPSLRRNCDGLKTLLTSVGEFFVRGYPIHWNKVYPRNAAPVSLPVYPYQRRRYWPQKRQTQPVRNSAALSGVRIRSPLLPGYVFETRISVRELPYLADHRVGNRTLLPLTALLELVRGAASQVSKSYSGVADVSISAPLEIGGDGIVVQVALDGDSFRIFSLEGESWKEHSSGQWEAATPNAPARSKQSGAAVLVETHYERLEHRGLHFGPAFRTIRELSVEGPDAWARVRLGDSEAGDYTSYGIHPALLDGCLQTALAAVPHDADQLYLPFALERFELFGSQKTEVLAHARIRSTNDADTLTADIHVTGIDGSLAAIVTGLRLRRVADSSTRRPNVYAVQWPLKSREQPTGTSPRTLLIAGSSNRAGSIQDALRDALGARGCTVSIAPAVATHAEGKYFDAIILLGATDCEALLHDLQEILTRFSTKPPQVWLVTRNTVRVRPEDRCEGIFEFPAVGLMRSAALEHPELRSVRVDIDETPESLQALVDEIAGWDGETEIAFRSADRHVCRLLPDSAYDAGPKQWKIEAGGAIENLKLHNMERRAPGPREVEVEIEYSALNFRDTLNALGVQAGPLGLEFCGRIRRVGPNTNSFSSGDRVMGLGWNCLAFFVTTSVDFVIRVPASWTSAEAATVPNAFLTAHHCLMQVAGLRAGERVLIHAAAGGVGLAAVQVAQRTGAEIFATAGSEEKRKFLRSLGIRHVFSSRSTDFVREIQAVTNGAGVEVVLNSLAGEFVDANFHALAERGRFVEIGKRDVLTATEVETRGRGRRYDAVDLMPILKHQPALIRSHLDQLRRLFEASAFRPLPFTVFEFDEAPAGFRYMAQARHVGKIVFRHGACFDVRKDATYLITGGLGAIGLRLARWLGERGAGNLVLVSRHAPPESAGILSHLRSSGKTIEVFLADVSDREQLGSVLDKVRGTMPPLAGVFHAAGVIDDGPLVQQTGQRLREVMAPKVGGAWNLHELTANQPLDWFVLFSSVASLTGSPGQSSYAAGNAFLDALAHYRSARGLPALSINWGAWAESGMAARTQHRRRRSLSAIRPMAADDCIATLETIAPRAAPQIAIVDADWSQWTDAPRILADLSKRPSAPSAESPSLDSLLGSVPEKQRKHVLLGFLREHAIRILGLSSTHFVDEKQPLMKLGLDSLMALEFRNQLSAALARPLSATLLFDYPTLGSLAEFVLGSNAEDPTEEPDVLLETLNALSEGEAEELLKAELEQSER